MTVVFIDNAIDLPQHIMLKMPNVRVLERDVNIDGKKSSTKNVKTGIKNNAQIEFEQLSDVDYQNAFEPCLKAGDNVIYVSISSKFSKSVKRATGVIKTLNEQYPKQKIVHIDTCNLSIASGYLAYYVYRLVEQKIEVDEIKKIIDAHKISKYFFLIVDDLKHLKESEKIDSSVLSLGVKLNIKPILTINTKGQIEKYSQVSGPKKAIFELVNVVEKFGRNVADHRVGIVYSGNKQRAFDLKNSLLEKFNIENNVDIIEINPQILSCTGEGVLGIVFNGKKVR